MANKTELGNPSMPEETFDIPDDFVDDTDDVALLWSTASR